ncbi:MAG: cyclic nucleotide-binding domain-containing protein [Magnetospirillum sp.]|nr:cyclic nucleotide-binding domain-containing protein [Magnetospirillum sp.]
MLALVDTCQATATARGRLCACLEPPALGRLRAIAADERLAAGEVLFAPGQPAQSLYGVRQGAVMLVRTLGDGRRQVLSFLFPGDVFGFEPDAVHSCSAIALRRSGFCRFPLAGLDEDLQLAVRLHAVACACLAEGLEHMLRLGRMTAAERVAGFFYRLWVRLDRPAELHLPMRLLDVADHLGLRMETVCRHLAALRRAGVVGPLGPDGDLPVLDPEALRRR